MFNNLSPCVSFSSMVFYESGTNLVNSEILPNTHGYCSGKILGSKSVKHFYASHLGVNSLKISPFYPGECKE